MKTKILFIILFFLSFNTFSQIKFEPGYFIDNTGHRTDCLIKNTDWKDNPTEIEYKTTTDSEQLKASIDNVQEFGITNLSKYKRFHVKIDRSGITTSMLSKNIEPEFNEETLFLKSLVEGKANLYMYNEDNLRRYFYSVDGSDVEQLIYKKYRINVDTAYNSETLKYGDKTEQIRENNKFKQQLWVGLQCADITMKDAENLNYNKKDLINYFLKYNNCIKSDFVNFDQKQTNKNWFNLYITTGINYSSVSISNEIDNRNFNQDVDFGYKTSYNIGFEAEYIAPFNKGKWTLFIAPSYYEYKAQKEITYVEGLTYSLVSDVTIDHRFFEFPMGLRYYIFLTDNSMLFINAAFNIDYTIKSSIEYEQSILTDLYPIRQSGSFGFGIGYNFKKKVSVQFKYFFKESLLSNYVSWNTDYNIFSVVLGYNLF